MILFGVSQKCTNNNITHGLNERANQTFIIWPVCVIATDLPYETSPTFHYKTKLHELYNIFSLIKGQVFGII